jgi:hypothetical protein
MAYYDALIAAWNNPTQPPPGVTGTGLSGTMTTDQKLVAQNGWTMVGPAVKMVVQATDVYNLINLTEYNALSAANQTAVNNLLSMGMLDASQGTTVRSRFVAIFPSGTQTFTALSNFAKQFDSPQTPWWIVNKYNNQINGQDLVNAGLS